MALCVGWMWAAGSSSTSAQVLDEKPKRIWNVEIEGNTRYEDLVIKQYIANERPKFMQRVLHPKKSGMDVNEKEIRKDVIRIERFYHRRGYLDAEVSYRLIPMSDPTRMELVFDVKEGSPIRITKVNVQLNATKDDQEFIQNHRDYQSVMERVPFAEGKVFQQVAEAEVVGRITQTLKELGYVYAICDVETNVDTLMHKVEVTIINTAGPRARITDIQVQGQTTIAPYYIKRETGLKLGDYYSESSLREAQREVFKHHLFRLALVNIPEQPQDSTLELNLLVKELSLRSVRAQMGVGDFDRLTEPLAFSNFYQLLRSQLSWTYRNVRGRGEQFSTNLRLSYYDTELRFEYLFPYVYNTKSSFSFRPYIQNRIEKSYSITTGGLVNSFGYEYSRNLTGTFSYEFAVNNEYDVVNNSGTPETVLPDSVLAYNISSFKLNAYYTHGLVRGRQGVIVQPYVELSGLFGEASFSFQKAALDVRKYTQIHSGLVVATRVQGGAIYYAKQDSLPSDIRFYTGGTSAVRGWGRDDLGPKRALVTYDTLSTGVQQNVRYVPIGGKAFFNFNVEFRQNLNRIIKGFGVAAFLDGGQVWRSVRSLDERALQFGTGGGIRYASPIGPIRVDVAYKINPMDEDLGIYQGENYGAKYGRWRIHFSIGQAF